MIRPSLPALACIVTLAALAVAAEAAGRLAVEHHNGVPAQWTRLGATPRETSIALVIALKQQNLDVLEQTLLRVSDPRDAAYGRHLSHMEVQRLVAPQQESVQAVLDWLREHSVDLAHGLAISPNADFVRVVVPVSLAERMLQAEFHHFQHAASGHAVHRLAAPYTLPARLAAHVDFVGPTVRFPRVQRAALRLNALPDAAVTPAMLRQLYNVGAAEGRSPDNLQAVAQFLEQYYSPSDLAAFFARFYQPAVGRNVSRVQGPNTPSQPGMEATLDIQYIMALGGNVSTEFWSFPGRAPDNPENEPFLDWLLAIASDPHPPHVFSVSYGDNEDSVTPQYAARVNAEFQKAGARGVSLLFSSGDGGVGGGQPTRCTAFVPTFPAGSPWVTAVGGTTGSAPEVAASLSSGGFSNYWAAPDFQRSAIATYLASATGLPDTSRFNSSGAGIPDVAAQAEGFGIVYSGYATGVSGTSASSPTFAGIVSLLNDLRLQAGKTPLGFLNPLFYQNPSAFNDITSGSNPGCGTSGFPAAKGWDPVTGLGTPDFGKLSQLVASLP